MADPNASLETFKNKITNIVRPNKFLVLVTPPVIVTRGTTNGLHDNIGKLGSAEELMFWATSAVIPDRNFNEISVKHYGMELKIPASEVLQDLVINFICDADWKLRNLFEKWTSLINNRNDNTKASIVDVFDGASITVKQLSFTNDVIATYEFMYPYPKTVDQIELNQETSDTHETCSITFGYSSWRRV